MAKLKGPLFSLGAAGQIGKALVYFGWKGLDVVREYVIPSNPRTAGQTTQRGYMTQVVAAIHAAQAVAANPLDAADVSAYALLASVVKAATTWFNQLVKLWLDQLRAGLEAVVWSNGSAVPGAGQLTMFMWGHVATGAAITAGNLWYGTSKTALIHSFAATPAQLAAGRVIAGLTAGVKYYVQYRPTTPAGYVGCNSGIYYGTPT